MGLHRVHVIGKHGHQDMQRSLRVGQGDNSIKVCFTYSVGQPIRNSCLVKVQMLHVRGTVRGSKGCDKQNKKCLWDVAVRVDEPRQRFSERETNSEKSFNIHNSGSV